MSFKNSEQNINKWNQEMIDLVKLRNHKLISGKMTTHQRDEGYTIYCPVHDLSIITSFFNYKRSRTGCLFCGREIVSAKLTGPKFSLESLEKMKISARSRPDRGGKSRRWRETYDYRSWNTLVRKEWNNQCAITGIQNYTKGDGLLVVHHLVGVSHNESLALTVENGIFNS
jgi:hypothetical protein